MDLDSKWSCCDRTPCFAPDGCARRECVDALFRQHDRARVVGPEVGVECCDVRRLNDPVQVVGDGCFPLGRYGCHPALVRLEFPVGDATPTSLGRSLCVEDDWRAGSDASGRCRGGKFNRLRCLQDKDELRLWVAALQGNTGKSEDRGERQTEQGANPLE